MRAVGRTDDQVVEVFVLAESGRDELDALVVDAIEGDVEVGERLVRLQHVPHKHRPRNAHAVHRQMQRLQRHVFLEEENT